MEAYYKIGLAVSNFYPELSQSLEEGVRRVFSPLENQGKIEVTKPFEVPGSAELPLALDWLFQHQGCAGVIGLGAVIRGKTSHYDSVCRIVDQGFLQLQLKWSKPVVSGVLMTESLEQAEERLSLEHHKGEESAKACLNLLHLFDEIKTS